MALQFRLGLLSERRIRAGFTHLNHIAAYGTDITPSGIFLDRWTPVKSQLAEDGDHSSERELIFSAMRGFLYRRLDRRHDGSGQLSPLLVGILKFRHRLQHILSRARQGYPILVHLETVHGDRHIVLAHSKESADPNDCIGH